MVVTFVGFVAGSLIESTHANLKFMASLTAITAAVVGVIPVILISGILGFLLALAKPWLLQNGIFL